MSDTVMPVTPYGGNNDGMMGGFGAVTAWAATPAGWNSLIPRVVNSGILFRRATARVGGIPAGN